MTPLPGKLLLPIAAYRNLLEEIDAWFMRCQALYPEEITCHKGCHACCRGLFDITLLDAALLQQGIAALPLLQQQLIQERALERCRQLQERWPQLCAPWTLNHLPEDEWQQMPEDDPTPCVLLGADGQCVVYAHRPMLCRLHGLPNIDVSGEDFSSELCTRNFTDRDPMSYAGLRWKFRETFTQEIELLESFARELSEQPRRGLDTFIPLAVLIDFAADNWREK